MRNLQILWIKRSDKITNIINKDSKFLFHCHRVTCFVAKKVNFQEKLESFEKRIHVIDLTFNFPNRNVPKINTRS